MKIPMRWLKEYVNVPMSAEEYAGLVSRFVDCLREDIVLDRFVSETPKELLIAPSWSLKPSEFAALLDSNDK